jgi:hypothetical protein
MRQALSVKEALASLSELAGSDVCVRGVLHFSFEDVALYQWPREQDRGVQEASIWLSVGSGSLGFDKKACEKLSGKVVLVEGTLFAPDAKFGCGHMGLWPAELLARTLEKST